ncbi:hypothetical protein S7711_05732 [Stachybotrys chartarum IBT 7711]|uniref:DUF1941 family protein n=1 Tax=Stachybotrys chartarum (strain CBS 109288 / IBT 7711) TaxID=1280523 RepID=A0A084AVT9_STACB|nr:hypothetical protein S7711_05732 [Stachybotrys chartarum IBT 7711]
MASNPQVPGMSLAQDASAGDAASVDRIKALLEAKDDTQRFVGLALLKTVLDNSQDLRQDIPALQALWHSLSPKFLDRLLMTGPSPSNQNARDMLDLAVSVLHTFANLLPDQDRDQPKFIERLPKLVAAVLQRQLSSGQTTELILQLLYTLVSRPDGARALVAIGDLSSITEIAPSQPIVLHLLCNAWLNTMTAPPDNVDLKSHVSTTIQGLVSSFRSTDAVTLLEFLGTFLRQADPAPILQIIPSHPKWLKAVVGYIQNLVTSRPTPEARSAYTNAAASLLQTYPSEAQILLFSDHEKDGKPFAYLFVNLLLIDIRSTVPSLLEQLNSSTYSTTSRRLASAFDVICFFIGYLVRSLDDEAFDKLVMPPESLLKLRKGISETMSVTLEYLRDRWDASVAGAMGLHPDARTATAEVSTGSRLTLAWDSKDNSANQDPFTLSAVRALALWLREDENETLRGEATGLTDMLLELYQLQPNDALDFRSPVLVAFEALVTLEQGREMLLNHNGWELLSKDLVSIIHKLTQDIEERDLSRGIEIVRVLLAIADQEASSTPEAWMDLITTVAAWPVPDYEQKPSMQEFEVAALQLCCTLIVNAGVGMRNRFKHSISAIVGLATTLNQRIPPDNPMIEAMEDVLETLNTVNHSV